MKHINFSLLLASSMALFFSACDLQGIRAKGDLQTETRNVTGFHAIESDLSGDVEVRVDSTFKVEVTCEENVIDDLETKVENGVLNIYFDRTVFDVDDLKIVVHAPSWDAFELNGSGNIKVLDDIAGTELDLDISGSGEILISEADFDKIKARISGSGEIEVDGITDLLDVDLSGSGEVSALDCLAKNAKVDLSGSGNVRVYVTETLDVEISGSGNVSYKGEPQVTKSITGSGSVKKL